MSSFVFTLFYFLIALAVLIAVHEFGHFYAARCLKVHVIRFSIGFGKKLFSFKDKKGTEFALSLIPLGGYVKLLGESDDEPVSEDLKHKAFTQKPVWARMIILAAGPLFNFLLAFIALWGMFVIGITSLAPVISQVAENSIAWKAHLRPMDSIAAIEDEPVNSWRAVQLKLMPFIGSTQPVQMSVRNFETGEYRHIMLDLSHWDVPEPKEDLLKALGVTPELPHAAPVISEIFEGYPAQKAGLKAGDRIIAVNGKKVVDWLEVVSAIQAMPERPVELTISRDESLLQITVYPLLKKEGGKAYGFIGAQSKAPQLLGKWLRIERYSIVEACVPALKETYTLSKISLFMVGKLLTGALSLNNISGPVGIAELAGQAAHLGWAYYLSFIALVSVSLGVLNLLPIPVLDGGHLLYCVFELILRRPLSEKVRTKGNQLGFLLLMALMVLAVVNDLSRFN